MFTGPQFISNYWAFSSTITAYFPLAFYSQPNEHMERGNQGRPCCSAWLHPIHPLRNPSSCGINALANTPRVFFMEKSPFERQMGYLSEQNVHVQVPDAEKGGGSC